MFLAVSAGSGGGLDTEGGWVMPDTVVSIRKLGKEIQTAAIRQVMLVSLVVRCLTYRLQHGTPNDRVDRLSMACLNLQRNELALQQK